MYQFQEFPKWKYHVVKEAMIVGSKEAEEALGSDWVDSPAQCQAEIKTVSEELPAKKPLKRAKA